MKKVLFSVLIMGLVFTTSCNKDDDSVKKTCQQRAEDIADAASAYAEEFSTENCQTYRNAIQAYIDSDCPGKNI